MSSETQKLSVRLTGDVSQPLLFQPVFSRRRWGGRKLAELLHKSIGFETDYAESWEVADHADGQSVVAEGVHQGATLRDLLGTFNREILGPASGQSQFPLLIKYLDANDWLSLQVHPNDQQAKRFDASENGKTEAWVILHADPGSEICCGLKPGITAQDLTGSIKNGTVKEVLHIFPAVIGDCIFVPAGTVHAIGPGIVLAEVQQQSNLTFRLYDWGRLGTDGKPRETHLNESLECIDFERGPVQPTTAVQLSSGGHSFSEIARCDFFAIRRHESVDEFSVQLDQKFRILMITSGKATICVGEKHVQMSAGQTTLIPAVCECVKVIPEDGRATVLEVLQPGI